jgi:transcriptional regulator NrdR family protein
MKHTCSSCEGTTFRVVETFPYARHTLRQLKCRSCGTNFFTHEYIMQDDEYCWQKIKGDSRLRLREQ